MCAGPGNGPGCGRRGLVQYLVGQTPSDTASQNYTDYTLLEEELRAVVDRIPQLHEVPVSIPRQFLEQHRFAPRSQTVAVKTDKMR